MFQTMNNFLRNFFTIFIFLAGFFVFLGGSSAQACEIIPGETKTRVPAGSTIEDYSETDSNIYHFDIATENCTNNDLILEIWDMGLTLPNAGGIGLYPHQIGSTNIYIRPTGSTPPAGNTFFFTDQSRFTIPLRLGEELDDQCIGAPGAFGWDNGQIVPNSSAYELVFSDGPPECMLYFKLSVVGGGSYNFGNNNTPAIAYTCDGLCNLAFIFNGQNSSYCPITGTSPLEYETSCLNYTGTTNILVPIQSTGVVSSEYSTEPLAPLPGFTGSPTLGQWLESLFTILIVVAGILSLIMIIVGGMTYITSESFGDKGKGKTYIINAITGLVLALGAWVILNTINPDLAEDLDISIPTVSLTIDQEAFVDYEQEIETGQSFVLSGTFENPQTSPGLSDFLNNINAGNSITSISVSTSSSNMTIISSSGSNVTIPVTGIGAQGVSEVGQGVEGDRKTPKGNWQITSDIRISQNQNDAQTPAIGNFNMGPAFIGTNITTPSGTIRGIGIHGNKNNTPGPTMGCVRIKNDDVLALARKMTPGVTLIIN